MSHISVVIPVFNGERFIEASLRSALEQTHPPLEVLVVDDGSTDRTRAICEAVGGSRVRLIRQDNRGVARARNAGIELARGDFIAFLDADDEWHPTKLERHLEHLQEAPRVGVSFTRCQYIDEAGEPLGIVQKRSTLERVSLEELLCRCPVWTPSAVMVRRGVLEDVRYKREEAGRSEVCYFDPEMLSIEDTELWYRIALHTPWRFGGIPELLTRYRLNQEGICAKAIQAADEGTRFRRMWDKVKDQVKASAPERFGRLERRIWAYHWRCAGQKALLYGRDDAFALRCVYRALASDWHILAEEPYATGMILAGAHAQAVLPRSALKGARLAAQHLLLRSRLHDRL